MTNTKNALTDKFGRTFTYLRLSITDICNFKCMYCLPDGNSSCSHKNDFLSITEIDNLVQAFVELGFKKIRITGGEPALRKDLTEIIKTISKHPEITTIALTTNGYNMHKHLGQWIDAGLTNINISIDSLDNDNFQYITGVNKLPAIMRVMETINEFPLREAKVNTVLLKGINDQNLQQYLDFVQEKRISLRFIELMQTDENSDLFEKHHISSTVITDFLQERDWTLNKPKLHAGPAQVFQHDDYKGSIGVIAPYSNEFCDSCNRLRVSSQGNMEMCLFGNQAHDLRPLLQSSTDKEELIKSITDIIHNKQRGHSLHDNQMGGRLNLSTIGG